MATVDPNTAQVRGVYSDDLTPTCTYDIRFGQKDIPITPTLSPQLDNTGTFILTFNNITKSNLSLTCSDGDTSATINVIGGFSDFLIAEQIRDFRDGKFGTSGMFGYLDLVTIIIILVAMLGFNALNETVGVVVAIITIAFATLFELITFPAVLFPIFALVVMVVIATTRKD